MSAWEAWYDREADDVGVEALLWIDDRSPDRVTEIESLLTQIDSTRLSVGTALDILNATWCLKEFLPSRPRFVDAVHAIMVERLGIDRADHLIRARR